MNIASMTREEYFNDVDLVTSRAIAAGVKGEAYEHHPSNGIPHHGPEENPDLFRAATRSRRQTDRR